jgi:hypothetical protein
MSERGCFDFHTIWMQWSWNQSWQKIHWIMTSSELWSYGWWHQQYNPLKFWLYLFNVLGGSSFLWSWQHSSKHFTQN